MFAALRDCCVPLHLVLHEEQQDALLEAFDKEVMGMMQEVSCVWRESWFGILWAVGIICVCIV